MTLVSTVDVQSIRPSVFVYPLGVWGVMAIVAVVNGIFRETMLVPRLGDDGGHLVSTALLVAAILVLSYVSFTASSIDYRQAELLLVGVFWVVLTVGFEFLVGYLEGAPVGETIAQYDVSAGNVWIVVLLTLLVAPLLFGSSLAE